MPAVRPDVELAEAQAAVAFAKKVRAVNARRTDKSSAQRAREISTALQRLREAMAPLRTMIGRFPYGPQTKVAEANRQAIREASQAIQKERRKLHKMSPK